MLNITKGQVLYVILNDASTIKPTKIIDIVKIYEESVNPDYYMDIDTRYLDSKTNGTVTFHPKDFGIIIFYSEQEAKQKVAQYKFDGVDEIFI
jgi:hypothetical protein